MDIKISGSGAIAAGEYKDISVSGSAKCDGKIRCNSLRVSGSMKGMAIDAYEDIKVSGSVNFDGDVTTKNLKVSGGSKVGSCKASNDITVSGALKARGIHCAHLRSSGALKVEADIEAEEIVISGLIKCGGLMNAESIKIEAAGGSTIENIGGSNICIVSEKKGKIERLPLFSKILGNSGLSKLTVAQTIEGDSIAIEYVIAKQVIGKNVAVGAGCDIELVQYTDEIELSPDAKVAKYEKI